MSEIGGFLDPKKKPVEAAALALKATGIILLLVGIALGGSGTYEMALAAWWGLLGGILFYAGGYLLDRLNRRNRK